MKKRSRNFIRASILPIVVSIPLAFIAAVVASQIQKTGVIGEVETPLSRQLVKLAPNLSAPAPPRTLSLADRVAYQYAIEEVYWRHRIWPNKESKPSLNETMPATQVQRKVENYLRNSQLLADQWQRPITAEQLQTEMDRMASQTKQPEVLRELFAALNHDPTLIAECLARPALSDRLARELYAHDANFHGELKRRVESELRDHPIAKEMKRSSGSYTEAEWMRSDDEDQTIREKPVSGDRLDTPGQVKMDATEWEANSKELASHLGKQDLNQVATGVLSALREEDDSFHATAVLKKEKDRLKVATITWQKEPFESWASRTKTILLEPTNELRAGYNLPTIAGDSTGCADGTWTPTSTINAPPGRSGLTAIWTGAEMIAWGGQAGSSCCYLTSGGRYDPSTDSWVPTTTINAPSGRVGHTAVWTGSEMIIWGGYTFGSIFQPLPNGGRYNPRTDSWVPTTNTNASTGAVGHTTVWTGSEMIVWGGSNGVQVTNGGKRYNPNRDSWIATATNNAPVARDYHASVWTGTEMIVWGGYSASTGRLNSGGKYDPSTDSWTATAMTGAPEKRSLPTAIWTGHEMIVWGGNNSNLDLNTGGRYNPLTNTWVPTSIRICCDGRSGYSMIWTGYEMIVWGGSFGGGGATTYGEKYQPNTDTWLDITSVNEPSSRSGHAAVWTGSEMIVWGGTSNGTGGRFCAPPPPPCANDTWTATSLTNAPDGRVNHTAVWTGSEMIVWGGQIAEMILNSGGTYDPAIDSWSPTSLTNAPAERISHTAVWTGTEMIIWGGVPSLSTFAVNTGGKYNPATDSWVATATTNAPARLEHTAVWTNYGMIIWGGVNSSGLLEDTGGRYQPGPNNWSAISNTNAPSARSLHTAICTGNDMIVWGGASAQNEPLNTGGRFNLVTFGWSPTTTNNAPAARAFHSAVWSGNEMIIWGGSYADGGQSNGTGGRYNPVTDSWAATNVTNAPKGRDYHTAVWTGRDMIVWGGEPISNTGGRYDPIADTWTVTATDDAPEGRQSHTAVWTGREMIVWGGNGNGPTLGFNSGGSYCAYPQIATASISGASDYCSNPDLSPVAGVTMSLTGSFSASTLTDGSGNYAFASLATNGNYEVTPRKTSLAPGSAGVNTIDVLAVQRHFLNLVLLPPGCRITAADVNEDGSINTLDLVAMQRFFLGLSTGIANVGQYRFNPAQRSYGALSLDQMGQNYDALVLGDVAAAFVH